MQINKQLLNQMLKEKYVQMQKHPEADLFIYNYTRNAEYNKVWNEVTLQTRGLILDSEMNIVALPLKKFFNDFETKEGDIPNLPFEVYEKMDGIMGVIYFLNDKPYVASRGSFNSKFANKANEMLYGKYSHVIDKLDKTKTYIVEIIYPEGKIVVDYGGKEELVLLAIIDTETGLDLPLEDIGFPVVKKYDGIKDINILRQLEEKNKEGFIVKFSNGFRMKVKFKEYFRLHQIITQVSSITIWEHLSQNRALDELLDNVPDEFYDWVKKTSNELLNKFNSIMDEVNEKYYHIIDRKEFSKIIEKDKYKGFLFTRLNSYSQDLNRQIWDTIRPEFSKPFLNGH